MLDDAKVCQPGQVPSVTSAKSNVWLEWGRGWRTAQGQQEGRAKDGSVKSSSSMQL